MTSTSRSDGPKRETRPYDSRLRKQRAAETRERIIAAASELIHHESVRDWKKLTVRAVAEKAGVNERTVYRYFGTERGLRDALLQRNEDDAGIDLVDMQLIDIPKVTVKLFEHISQYPREPMPALVPTLVDAMQRQRAALINAVESAAQGWPREDQLAVAAVLDVLWSVASYERLVGSWQLEPEVAVHAITWALELVGQAIAEGHAPRSGSPARPQAPS
jgi:AcrR family transcriptional regulator